MFLLFILSKFIIFLSIYIFFYTLQRASFWPPSMVHISVINTQTLQITFFHDVDLLWAAFHIHIQIWTNQLLIFTEKFSFLPGFEPRTSSVPSRYATNWAILAWISNIFLCERNCPFLKMRPYFILFSSSEKLI